MSPVRRWPPPHKPQGCSFCPWFFPGPQAFPAANSPKSVTPARSSGGGGTGPQPGVSLWWGRGRGPSSQGSARSPFPGFPRGSQLELPRSSRAFPAPPPCPRPPSLGAAHPSAPGSVGEGMFHLGVTSATPYPSAVLLLAGGSGWGWDGAAEQRSPQLSLDPVDFLARKVGSAPPRPRTGPSPAPEPQLCAGLCCSVPVPAAPGSCSRSCVRVWSVHVPVCLTPAPRAVTPAPGGPRAAPPLPAGQGAQGTGVPSRWDQGHVPGTPAPAQVD